MKRAGKTRKHLDKKSIICILVPLILCVAYAIICAFFIQNPVHPNEAEIIHFAHGGDVKPFTLALNGWEWIAGHTLISLRFLSIFAGALSIIFFFQLAKRWFNLKTTAIITTIFAFNPILIFYGQIIHSYNLVMFLLILMIFFVDHLFPGKNKIQKITVFSITGLVLLAMTVFGAIGMANYQPVNPIAKLIPSIQEISEENEPIIIDEDQDFYSAEFYEKSNHPVIKLSSAELDEILAKHGKIWFVTSNNDAKTYSDYQLPDKFMGYQIVSDVINNKIVALELEKTEK